MSLFMMVSLGIALGCNLIAGVLSYLILYTDLFKSLRIQGQRYRSGIFWKRLPLISFNLSVLALLTYLGLTFAEPLFTWEQTPFDSGAFWVFIQLAILMLIDDAYFYFFHRLLHENSWLYRHIYKIHYRAFAPFPLEYIYVHPLEWMIGAGGIPLGLGVIYLIQGEVSVWAFWFFAAWRNLHEVDIHSGLRSYFGKYLPWYGTTEHHDQHHLKKSMGNYGSAFTFWDWLLGTELDVSNQSTAQSPRKKS